jgi:CBS domain-containing protein/ferredoxin
MTRDVTTVTREVTLRDLEALFEKHDFNSFPVMEQGKLLGIVTKFDFLKAFAFTTGQMVPHYDELMKRPVAEMMTEAVMHVEPTAPLTRVLELMVSLKARSFPVIGPERKLVGVICREDVCVGPRAGVRRAGESGMARILPQCHDAECSRCRAKLRSGGAVSADAAFHRLLGRESASGEARRNARLACRKGSDAGS